MPTTLDDWIISIGEPVWKDIAFVLLFRMEARPSPGSVPCDVRVHVECITKLLCSALFAIALASVSCGHVEL